jgi:hypothetical protein
MSRTVCRLVVALCVAVINPAGVSARQDAYPKMAPLEKYLSTNQSAEIAMARSAAPASISDKAEVLVLGADGYKSVVKGTNGFVCYVARSWDNDVDNAEFWNPKTRGPMCLNPAAVRSALPYYLQRTKWVLSGVSRAEITDRIKAAVAAKAIKAPESGAMSYMLSKDGYLGDGAGGPWYPHVMFWGPPVAGAEWGADVPGSPIISAPSDQMPFTMFFILVRKWSDGTLATYGSARDRPDVGFVP